MHQVALQAKVAHAAQTLAQGSNRSRSFSPVSWRVHWRSGPPGRVANSLGAASRTSAGFPAMAEFRSVKNGDRPLLIVSFHLFRSVFNILWKISSDNIFKNTSGYSLGGSSEHSARALSWATVEPFSVEGCVLYQKSGPSQGLVDSWKRRDLHLASLDSQFHIFGRRLSRRRTPESPATESRGRCFTHRPESSPDP